MIVVTSSSPQSGKSVLAANLAFELGAKQKTCLVDANFYQPSQHTYFNLSNAPASLSALCRLIEQDRLTEADYEGLSLQLVVPKSKITLLAGNPNPAISKLITQSSFETLVEFLKLRYESVVVDLNLGENELSEKQDFLLESSRQILVTCNADQVSIARFIASLERLSQSVDFEKATLVFNRVRESVLGQNPEKQISETISKHTPFKRLFFIPEDPAFDRALLTSVPLDYASKKSAASNAIKEIAETLVSTGVLEQVR